MRIETPYDNPYFNPYMPSFDEKLVTSRAAQYKTGSAINEDAIVFRNNFQSLLPPGNADGQKSTKFQNDFYTPRGVTSLEDDNFPSQSLVLRRKNFTETELCDPATNDVMYTIHTRERRWMSPEPDLEITSTALGGASIGTIHLGPPLNEIKSTGTGKTSTDIKKFSPACLCEQTHGVKLVWKMKKRTWKYYDYPRNRSVPFDPSLLWCGKELFSLELVDTNRADAQPVCTVRLFLALPNGRFEIYSESACINSPGGERATLDELVLSAYANMEHARLALMRGSDPTQPMWKSGNLYVGLILLVLVAAALILSLDLTCAFCKSKWAIVYPV